MTVGRIPSVEGGIQPTLLDAKGDLIAASAADTPQRLAVGSNNQVLTADSSTATGLKWANGGKVLQVINATTTTVIDNSTSTFADTTLTATITPTASTSKILVIVFLNVQKSNSNVYATTRLVRNSTSILTVATQAGYTGNSDYANIGTDGVTYLDSPATTSATTYKMQIASATNAANVTAQGGMGLSSITLMEIGA